MTPLQFFLAVAACMVALAILREAFVWVLARLIRPDRSFRQAPPDRERKEKR